MSFGTSSGIRTTGSRSKKSLAVPKYTVFVLKTFCLCCIEVRRYRPNIDGRLFSENKVSFAVYGHLGFWVPEDAVYEAPFQWTSEQYIGISTPLEFNTPWSKRVSLPSAVNAGGGQSSIECDGFKRAKLLRMRRDIFTHRFGNICTA